MSTQIMSEELVVKICGVREENDIHALSFLPIDYMGFIFVPESPRFFGEDLSILERAKSKLRMKMVAVVKDASFAYLSRLIESDLFDGIQLHGREDVTVVNWIREQRATIEVIRAVGVSHSLVFANEREALQEADLSILDNSVPGSGTHFDWEILSSYGLATPFLLAGGIGPEDVGLLQQVRKMCPAFLGVDVSSKFEIAPGRKDVQRVARFLEEVRR